MSFILLSLRNINKIREGDGDTLPGMNKKGGRYQAIYC